MNLSFLKQNFRLVLLVIFFLFALYSSYLIFTNVQSINNENHLVLLAKQFLRLHLAIPPTEHLPLGDFADYYSNFYLYFGPLASILLMPFVAVFGLNTPQTLIGIGSLIGSFILVYFLSKQFKFSTIDALWLAMFIAFSTALLATGLINLAAYQVEALGVPLVFAALVCYFAKKHPVFVGTFLALATLTRFTLMLGIVFFIVEWLQKRISVKQMLFILLPVVLAIGVLGLYNERRFHSFFETGYNYNITLRNYPLSENLQYGTMSIAHLPANLYSLLIMAPQPLLQDPAGFFLKFPYFELSPWGVAIWYTSPLFLFLLFRFRKGKYTVSAALAAVVLAMPVLFYYSIGFAQAGYRYALDFLPFLFLLLLPSLSSKLSKVAIFLICAGILFNCIYITSLWKIYPIFGIFK